ncbi:protein ALP1-like [Lolium perenne]|uniref:protein ALP1-like n=1 Tax=Lolium perenne TaxID=4522 RepID=UPI003A99BE70
MEGDMIAAFQAERDRLGAHDRLFEDYFADDCNYPPSYFRRRYRMRRSLFLRIVDRLGEYSPYFTQRNDALNRAGFSPLQKCTAALRLLAYGAAADTIDEWLKLARQTSSDCLDILCEGIIDCYGEMFCHRLTVEDTQRLLAKAEERGFPGMLGSIDCMHWQWRNCPVAHAGQFTRGDIKHPTIILEAVASYDRWIWHAFFGVAGSNNDINVLNQSPLFTDTYQGEEPVVNFTVNGHEYNYGYYLADGIYPSWPVFMKGVTLPQSEKQRVKEACFTKNQEACRKDIERAFGVLQAKFAIVRGPARFWDKETLVDIMTCCVILHNMIIEDERGLNLPCFYNNVGTRVQPERNPDRIEAFLAAHRGIENAETHHQLTQDLIDHHWQLHGQ